MNNIILRWLMMAMTAAAMTAVCVQAAEPQKAPILKIETGMHTASITRIGIDSVNRFLVTGSHDKTVRVWELPSGRLLSVLRLPDGIGNEGKIYAVAISPDGKTVACGGWTGHDWENRISIYLFNRATGELIRRIGGLPNITSYLSYSPDGVYLAAALYGQGGIRVYRNADGALIGEDKDYGAASGAVVFDVTSRIAAASLDGFIRLYAPPGAAGLNLLAKTKASGGKRPASLAFSPDGKLLAAGFQDTTKVNVLSAQDLSWLYSPDTSSIGNGFLTAVAFSADGRYLYAGGRYHNGSQCPIVVWDSAGKGERRELEGATNDIMHILPLKEGGIVYGTYDPAFGIIDKNHSRVFFKTAQIADYRGLLSGFKLSPDGKRVSFSYEQWGKSTASFDMEARTLILDRNARDLFSSDTTGLNVTDWYNSTTPKLNGRALRLSANEKSRSIAVSPGKDGFLLGADWSLWFFDQDGHKKWQNPVPGAVWSVNITRDGRFCVAAFADGTIRWYQVVDGKEILAFFPHKDRKRWVMWTPEGYFDMSGPDAADLIGYHINQGKDKEAKFFTLNNLYDVFYRPDIVQTKFKGEDIGGLTAGISIEQAFKTPPPEVKITSIPQSATENKVKVCYEAQSTGGGIGEVRLFHMGKLAYSDGYYREFARKADEKIKLAEVDGRAIYNAYRGLILRQKGALEQIISNVKGDKYSDCREIEAIPGENEVSIAAFNKDNTIQSILKTETFKADLPEVDPHLYILSIGINKFKDSTQNLRFAAKDGGDFANKLVTQARTIYKTQNIHHDILLDEAANKQNITAKIEEISRKIKPTDEFIFFVASHGILDPDPTRAQYYIITHDYNGYLDKGNTISSNELLELSKKIKALNQLIVLDTCHAGGVDNIISGLYDARMSVLAKKMGLHIYASANTLQKAIDGYKGNGLFTYTLLDGLNNNRRADKNSDSKVSLFELGDYSRTRTMDISTGEGYKQEPMIRNFGKDNPVYLIK
jgi:WD40 repeat protein